ncbi:efflux RND transporter periplasmic adaptor subunit [Bacillus sp. FJAT-47783]|uniref:efflux RND transporter periplasmic adaptor subunit n=1 Tax=Bacillus sp. FJAT-47783 TaxID=2922712 RepID=UPI001FAE44C3|nr:efflux RND transporter periplasmic adaptor subunit [Bacillus sp. FJAT-47783]
MKKVWIGIGIAATLLLIIGISIFRTQADENITVQTTKLKEKEITGNVMIPGTLQLANEQKVYFDSQQGEVKKIHVKEGDSVKKGTPLVTYENEQLMLEEEQNQLAIESNYIRINQIKDQIKDLEDKKEELAKQVGEKEAKKQIESEKDQLETEKKMANIELRQNLLQKETIQKKIAELEVKSDIDGVIIAVDEEAKNSVEPKVFIHIGSLKSFKVNGVISEYDSLKVAQNQPVTLTSDVLPDEKWKGTVSHIGTLPEQGDAMAQGEGAVQYPIEATVTDENIKAKPGFKLIMEIETERKKVNVLPLEAIKQEDDSNYVFVVEGGKAVKKEVKVGTADEKVMEIKSGVEKDDQIILKPVDSLKPGMEVTVE